MDGYFRDWSALTQKVIRGSQAQRAEAIRQMDAAQLADAFNNLIVYHGAITNAKMCGHAPTDEEMTQAFEES